MNKVQYDASKVRSVLVEVPILNYPNAGSYDFPLPVVQVLQSAKAILAIEAFNTTMLPKIPGQKTNASDAVYKTAFLTLGNANNEEVRTNVPLAKLIRSNGNADVKPVNVFAKDNTNPIDPQKCKVRAADTAMLTNDTVFLLEFTYLIA